MSWWSMITTKGRLLPNLCLYFTGSEIRISYLRLEEGENPAILIDQSHNKARIYAPFEACQRLAALHRYELVVGPRRLEEEQEQEQEEATLVSHVESGCFP